MLSCGTHKSVTREAKLNTLTLKYDELSLKLNILAWREFLNHIESEGNIVPGPPMKRVDYNAIYDSVPYLGKLRADFSFIKDSLDKILDTDYQHAEALALWWKGTPEAKKKYYEVMEEIYARLSSDASSRYTEVNAERNRRLSVSTIATTRYIVYHYHSKGQIVPFDDGYLGSVKARNPVINDLLMERAYVKQRISEFTLEMDNADLAR